MTTTIKGLITALFAASLVFGQEPPIITAVPPSQRAKPGSDVTLAVSATGPDLTYRWYRGTVLLEGANSNTLLLQGVQAKDTAGYRVVVRNSVGQAEAGPFGVVVTTAGPAEIWSHAIGVPIAVDRREAASGKYLGSGATPFSVSSFLNWDRGPDDLLHAAVKSANAIQRFNPATGDFVDEIPLTSPLNSRTIAGFAWGHDGNLYVSNPDSGSVTAVNGVTFSPVATLATWSIPKGFQGGEHIEIAPDGTVMVSSYRDGSVKFFRPGDGAFLGSTEVAKPFGLGNLTAFARRDNGDLLALDNSPGGAIHRFLAGSGAYAGIFIPGGTGGLLQPRAMCLGEDGVLYVSDEGAIRRYRGDTGDFLDSFPVPYAGPTLRYVRLAPTVRPEFLEPLVGGDYAGSLGITLSAKLSGTPPFRFQWRRDNEVLAGAHRNPLHLPGSLLTDSGDYQLIAWNAAGSATSTVAHVTLRPGRAEILGLPTRQEVIDGQPIGIAPTGVLGAGPFTYQWMRVLGTNLVELVGADQPTLHLDRFLKRHAGTYRLAISNSFGISTQNLQLVFKEPELPQILDQPTTLTMLAGAPMESPLLLVGRQPLTTTWWLNGIKLTNQFLPAPQLNANGPTSGTLIGVVSNLLAAVTSAPISLRIVGTNLYRQDFNGKSAPGWKPTFSQSSTNENRLGRFGIMNTNSVFGMTNDAPLGQIVFGFDVWAQDSWDGFDSVFGPDLWSVSVDGKPILQRAFSNNDDTELPSYFPERVWTPSGTVDLDPRLGSLGMDPKDMDQYTQPAYMGRVRIESIHRMRFEVVNSTNVFTAQFTGSGLSDESWALDNVYLVRPPSELAWIRVSSPVMAVAENAGECQVVVERSGNVQLPVDVRYATQDSGAIGGIDFIAGHGLLHFEPGDTMKSIRIPILDNGTADPLRSFGVWLLDAGDSGVFTTTPFTAVVIQDDESRLTLRPILTSIPSGTNGATVAQLERTGDLSQQRSVELEVVGGSAVFGDDFWITGIHTNRALVQFSVGSAVATARYNYGLTPPAYENPMVLSTATSAASSGPETLFLRALPSADFHFTSQPELALTVEQPASAPLVEIVLNEAPGSIRLRVIWSGTPSTRFDLESSEDLNTWVLTDTLAPADIKILPADAFPARYYRVRVSSP